MANEDTIEARRSAPTNVDHDWAMETPLDWIAIILEIRAADQLHVFARVYWMYFPDELPQRTIDGNKSVQGRQSYHGPKELIASTHSEQLSTAYQNSSS